MIGTFALESGSLLRGPMVVYEPPVNTFGDAVAYFNYTINDCDLESDIGKIVVNVLPVNDPPVAESGIALMYDTVMTSGRTNRFSQCG